MSLENAKLQKIEIFQFCLKNFFVCIYSIATESLQCASDIIDSDCQKGRVNFDSWLKGLQAAKERVCENNAALLRGTLLLYNYKLNL